MKVHQLRELLARFPDDAEVVTYQAATELLGPADFVEMIGPDWIGSARHWAGAILIDTAD